MRPFSCCDAERVEEAAHQGALIGQVIQDEHAAGDRIGKRGETRQMLRLAIQIEADDGLGPELLLLGDEQRRLNLIVDRFVVGPEGVRRRETLRAGHLLPQSRGRQVICHVTILVTDPPKLIIIMVKFLLQLQGTTRRHNT